MKMTIKLSDLAAQELSPASWKKLLENCGAKTEVSLIDILDSNGLNDALLATRCLPLRERRSLALRYDLEVDYCNHDPRISACHRATRQWLDGEITEEDLAEAEEDAAAAWVEWVAEAEGVEWATATAAAEAVDREQLMHQWCFDVESGVER